MYVLFTDIDSRKARTTRIPGRETPVSRKNFTGTDELILLYLKFQSNF